MNVSFVYKNGEPATLHAEGSTEEIVLAFCAAINQAYTAMCKSNRIVAGQFRTAMRMAVADPTSPVWIPSRSGEGIAVCVPKTEGQSHD